MSRLNKKGEIPETLEWIVATVVILMILIVFIMGCIFLFPSKGGVRLSERDSDRDFIYYSNLAILYLNSEVNGEKVKVIVQEKGIESKGEIEEYTKKFFEGYDFVWEVLILDNSGLERISNVRLQNSYGDYMCYSNNKLIDMYFLNSNDGKVNLRIFICDSVRSPPMQKPEGGALIG